MSTASDMVAAYIAAEAAVLKGQSFSLAGRSLTMADLPSIRAGRTEWERRVANESAAAGGRDNRYALADFSC